MASSSSRSRAATRRSPRPAPPAGAAAPAGERPLAATLAAVFGLLVAAVDGYLTWLLWTPEVGWDSYLLVPVLLGVARRRGRRGGVPRAARAPGCCWRARPRCRWPALLAVVVLFAVLGGGAALWGALALLVAPVGCLVLALRRPVREWTRPGRPSRPPGDGARRGRPASVAP